MKAFFFLASAMIVAAVTSSAPAQTVGFATTAGTFGTGHGDGGYGEWGYHASTALEGAYRGLADMIRAEGDYNFESSMAAINNQEARRRDLENRQRVVDTYFSVRRTNRDMRAAERPRGTPEDFARYARVGMPRLLTPSELDALTGKIAWPILLRFDAFGPERECVEKAFAVRAAMGSISPNDLLLVDQTTSTMLNLLRQGIHSFPPDQYLVARRFLESLAYEASRTNTETVMRPAPPALARAR
jgi:hypothetical protein